MKWIQQNLLSLIVIAILIILTLRGCKDGSFFGGNNKPQKPDTIHTSHTEYVQQPPVIIPQYIPTQTGSQQPIYIPSQYKPDTSVNGILRQYNDLLLKYLSRNNYNDSIVLKDTSGNRVGVVSIQDQISENKLVSRKPSYNLNFPVTTNTTVITKYAPQKWQIYLGAKIEGSKIQPLSAAGLGMLYKSKKDAIWGVDGKYDFYQNGMTYSLSRYFKLSFKHK